MGVLYGNIIDCTYSVAETVTICLASINGDNFQGLESAFVNACKKISYLEVPRFDLTSIVEIHHMVVCGEDPCLLSFGIFYYNVKHVLRFALSDEPISNLIIDPALLSFIP